MVVWPRTAMGRGGWCEERRADDDDASLRVAKFGDL